MSEATITCEHPVEERVIETDQDYYGNNYKLFVCGLCGTDLPGDPEVEAYDEFINRQVDEALGK